MNVAHTPLYENKELVSSYVDTHKNIQIVKFRKEDLGSFLEVGGINLANFDSPELMEIKNRLLSFPTVEEADLFAKENISLIGQSILDYLRKTFGYCDLLSEFMFNNPLVLNGYPVPAHSDVNWTFLENPKGFQVLWLLRNDSDYYGGLAFPNIEIISKYSTLPTKLKVNSSGEICVLDNISFNRMNLEEPKERLRNEEVFFRNLHVYPGTAIVFHKSCIHLPMVNPNQSTRLALSMRFVPKKNYCLTPKLLPFSVNSLKLGDVDYDPCGFSFQVVSHSVQETENSSLFEDHEIDGLKVLFKKRE